MAGHRNFEELAKRIGPARRARADKRVQDELRSMVLSELRKVAGRKQVEVAQAMGMAQSGLSRLESQDDMQISTLRRLIEALGGRLEIIADLPGGDRISLSQFADGQ